MARKFAGILESPVVDQSVEAYDIRSMIGNLRRRVDEAIGQLEANSLELTLASGMILEALRGGRRVLVAGNGGSAAEAQHFVAELVGRFKRERSACAVMSLTADSAVMTAIANDYGYDKVFARQVSGLGQPGDILLLFSTSGCSKNILEAARVGKSQGLRIIAIVGKHKCPLQALSDLAIHAASNDPATVQELHMMITHLLCGVVEASLCESSQDTRLLNLVLESAVQ